MLRRICCSDSPITDPMRNTLSTASSSGFQPTPSSRIGVIAARELTRPWSGGNTPHMILSSVLLPDPLRPMMPSASPRAHVEADVVQHLQRLEPARLEHAQDVLADRLAPHARDPERLRHAADLDERHV